MNSKERLQPDKKAIGFPEKQENPIEMDEAQGGDSHSGRGKNKLIAVIKELHQELAVTQEQLVEAQASNANWRERYTKLEARIDKIVSAARATEVDMWRGKLAKANIELNRLKIEKHNRDAFAEAGK